MPLASPIVLADALATPVNHTFIPLGPDSLGAWWYEDQSFPTPIGFWRVSISLTRAKPPSAGTSASDRIARVKVSLHEPTLEVVSNNSAGLVPAPVVAYVIRTTTEYILHERSTLQNRKDLRKMSALLQADVQVIAAVETLQNIY